MNWKSWWPTPLSGIGGISHLTRDAGDALEIICGVHDLDLAIIDFEHGPHGMTLLSAISALREDLPVIVITRDDEEHVEALAYANGATACFQSRPWRRNWPPRFSKLAALSSEQVCCLTRRIDNAKDESQRFSRTEQYPSSKKCRARSAGAGEAVIRITLTTICWD